jgi:hypothetical protein
MEAMARVPGSAAPTPHATNALQVVTNAFTKMMESSQQPASDDTSTTKGTVNKGTIKTVSDLPPGKHNRQGGLGVVKSCRACKSFDEKDDYSLTEHRWICQAYRDQHPGYWIGKNPPKRFWCSCGWKPDNHLATHVCKNNPSLCE